MLLENKHQPEKYEAEKNLTNVKLLDCTLSTDIKPPMGIERQTRIRHLV